MPNTCVRPSCSKLRRLRPEVVCWDMANGIAGGEGALKRPEEVTRSREDGEALIERLEKDALTAEERRVLVKVLTFYF